MKDAYYFSHDTNARRDPKILAVRSKYGAEGYAWYFMIIEILAEQKDYKYKLTKWATNSIAMELLCDANRVAEFINDCIKEFELFESDGEYFWSPSLIRRMQVKEEKRSKRAEAGRKGAEKRWGNSNAIAMPKQSDSNAIAKNSKVKESKVNEIYSSSSSYSDPPGKVFQFYQENIGSLSSHQAEVLNSYLDDGLEPELIVEAIKDSLGSDNKWRYLEAILQNCVKNNIHTLEQYNAAKVEHKNKTKTRDPTISAPAPLKTWAEIKEEQFQKNTREVIEKLKKEGYFDDG
jgi:DnaD/phage-associated family protein